MNPWITDFLLVVISSHKSRVGARIARPWASPRFLSVFAGHDSWLHQKLTLFAFVVHVRTNLSIVFEVTHGRLWLRSYISLDHVSGKPLELTFFISPYELLDERTGAPTTLTVDVVRERTIGQRGTVNLLAANGSHKLQTLSLISISKNREGNRLVTDQTRVVKHVPFH
jgi:hypothetical protein